MLTSVIVIISLGFSYFLFETVSAEGNTTGAILPTTGDDFSIWPIVIGVFLVLLAIVLFLKKKI
ncbi:LPXTG cell wall anchor domain-containing protein [Listeria ivanovii]|uniref:LPXTG cell wall anchor domain-containing protein n=1 Tax=Listeria ivanovii TaxID=1638 RepID=UPI00162A6EC2|nr:LPXTG cell wall anchor domain-containing protein [Listeria ivanovii]MBC1758603.1 LPXTG cell wall anchor domain-containing protein [Listeria ivanovii]